MQPGGKSAVETVTAAASAFHLHPEGGDMKFIAIPVPVKRAVRAKGQDDTLRAPVEKELREVAILLQARKRARLLLGRHEAVSEGQEPFDFRQIVRR